MSKILCLAVAFAAVTGAASATTITATFTGTMFNGYDLTGLFGPADTSLAGQAVTASFVFDPSVPGAVRDTGPNYDRLFGGPFFSVPNPLVSAEVTINGVTRAIAGAYLAEIGLSNSDYLDATANDIDANSQNTDQIYISGTIPGLPDSLDASFILTAADLSGTLGQIYLSTYDDMGNLQQYSSGGRFTVASVVFNAGGLSAVPLPASLPLMASALAGAALLRRRRAA